MSYQLPSSMDSLHHRQPILPNFGQLPSFPLILDFLHHCPALLPLTQPVACFSSLPPVFAVPPYCQLQSPLLPLLSRPAGAP